MFYYVDSSNLSTYFDGCLEQFPGAALPTLFHESGFPTANGNDAFELIKGSDINTESSIFVNGPNANWTHVFVAAQLGMAIMSSTNF